MKIILNPLIFLSHNCSIRRANFKSLLIFLSFFITISPAFATNWSIIPDKSSIVFTATQNNAPVTGKFANFNGTINFDPKNLDKSQIKIEVDMNSVTASYDEMTTSLKNEEWFSVKIFPKAIFESKNFIKIDDKNYRSDGFLTIRDKKIPVSLNFILEEYSEKSAKVRGFANLKRNDFGIGSGQWRKTDSIKDEVKVEFKINAKP